MTDRTTTIRELRQKRHSVRAIAKMTGLSKSMVGREVQKMGQDGQWARLSHKQAAVMMNVSERAARRARFICRYGVPGLRAMIDARTLKFSVAEIIAHLPHDQQENIVRQGPQMARLVAKIFREA